jgi:hypothetical protein
MTAQEPMMATARFQLRRPLFRQMWIIPNGFDPPTAREAAPTLAGTCCFGLRFLRVRRKSKSISLC